MLRSSVSWVSHATCGVSTTLSKATSGLLGGGGLGQHVEAGGPQAAAREGLDQRRLVDEPSARRVDQDGARLHAC